MSDEKKHNDALLDVKNLRVCYHGRNGSVFAVGGTSFSIGRSEVFSLVGESGCGKSTTAHAIARLLDEKKTRIEGEIRFEGTDLLSLPWGEMPGYRGKEIGMIFQNPLDSLNPLWTTGFQIGEALALDGLDRNAVRDMTEELLREVMLSDPAKQAGSYPHELSGGMRQRVMIAMMISRHPKLLIADEPTTALDVTIQSQILELLRELGREYRTSVLLITHDFGIVADMADRVGVMYAGRLIEMAGVRRIFDSPLHPYTQKLMRALPRIPKGTGRLEVIPGNVPDMSCEIAGCVFRDRCDRAVDACASWSGEMLETETGHFVSCIAFMNAGCAR